MNIPMLPSLEKGKINLDEYGKWVAENQNKMEDLASDLKITSSNNNFSFNNSDDVGISSIPDIWAHPKRYEIILGNPKHPLHKEYVNIWRGVMSLFVLRNSKGISRYFKVVREEIPDIKYVNDNEPSFLKVVSKLMPNDLKEKKRNNGTLIQIITYKGKPLGLIWPKMLLCPALGLENIVVDSIPWWRNGKVSDPIQNLSDSDKFILNDWINHVLRQLEYNDEESLLTSLLTEFKNNLSFDDISLNFSKIDNLGIEGESKIMDYSPVPAIDKANIDESHVKLITKKNSNEDTLLVISSDIAEQWEVPKSEIVIAGNVTFDSVASICTGNVIISDSNKKNINGNDLNLLHAEICTADDFFTDSIAVCSLKDRLSANVFTLNVNYKNNNDFVAVIPPIKSRILAYLDNDELKSNLRANAVGIDNDEIEVELDVLLRGVDGKGKFVTLRRIYKNSSDNKEIVEYNDIRRYPLIQVWPNFIFDDEEKWKLYYSFYDVREDKKANSFIARPFWQSSNKVIFQECINDKYVEIYQGDSFPNAYVCYKENEDILIGSKEEEIGILLLERPTIIKKGIFSKKVKIGVDFGTTNSIAAYSINDEKTEMMKFSDRLYSVTKPTLQDKNDLSYDFIPPYSEDDEQGAFVRSIFHLFNIDKSNFKENRPLAKGNIYYLESQKNREKMQSFIDSESDDENFDEELTVDSGIVHLDDNMKWDVNSTSIKEAFLLQFSVQCLAEAAVRGATSVDWAYSYPTSFTELQTIETDRTWERTLIPILSSVSSLSSDVIDKNTESRAMAEFFRDKMEAVVNSGMLCVDIGGGSTDIALWQGKDKNKAKMKYQSSLRFAGKKIINEYFNIKRKKDKTIFDRLGDDALFSSQLAKVRDANKEMFNIEMEKWLKNYEVEIINTLDAKHLDGQISLVIRDMLFSLAGLFYYMGRVIAYLQQKNLYSVDESFPNIYIGGNGSKLLDWACTTQFEKRKGIENVEKALFDCFEQGYVNAKFPNGIQKDEEAKLDNELKKLRKYRHIYKTDSPKEEVAYGLVHKSDLSKEEEAVDTKNMDEVPANAISVNRSENNDNSDQQDVEKLILLGEAYKVNGSERSEVDMSLNTIIENEVEVDTEIPAFKNFIKGFNKSIDDNALYLEHVDFSSESDDEELHNIVEKINLDLNKYRDKKVDEVVVEPFFISILSGAVNILASRSSAGGEVSE